MKEVLDLGHSYFLRGWIKGAYIGATSGGEDFSAGAKAFEGEQNAILTVQFQENNPDLYFLLCQGVLHEDIPPDPNSPDYALPHPDYWDRFLMACGVGYPNWVITNGIANPNQLAPGFWDGGPEPRKKGWVYFLPEDTSLLTVVHDQYNWYRNYGPLPQDEEITENFWGEYKNPADVERERHVFYYAWEPNTHGFLIRSIEAGNLCCQVMGWSKSQQKWIWPTGTWGDVKVWMKRGPNEWKYFFNLKDWMNANASAIATATISVVGAIVTAYTGGAAAPIIAIMVKGMQQLLSQAEQGGDAGTLLFTMFATSAQMAQVADQQGAFANARAEISKTVGKEAGKIVAWCEDVGKPFVKVYQSMKSLASQGVGFYGSLSGAAKGVGLGGLPTVDADFLDKALTNSVLGPASYWAKKAASLSDPKQIEAYIDSLPEYAKEAASFGGLLKTIQFRQVGTANTSLQFYYGPKKVKLDPIGSQGVMQLSAPMAKILGFPPAKYGPVRAKTNNGLVSASAATEVLPKPVQYGATAALVLGAAYFFRDYLFTKVLDKVIK